MEILKIIEKDVLGNYHFNGNFNNANSLKERFVASCEEETYANLIEQDRAISFSHF